ncbi:MAG: response regulator transcription factor [Porticoccaceae bacterium]|jgi:DNA-binding response OmpR family regulator|nr:response regulator transcription factor [Porticoccaceae bacterium]
MRLLVVEDNVGLADEINARLRLEGYACDWLVDGRDAANALVAENYDAVVLDLGLPGKSGLEVLTEWRQAGVKLPVMVLTARNAWSDRIAGLEAGADDYLGKPFHPDELVLRLRALIRRSYGADPGSTLKAGGLLLDESRQSVRLGDSEISLTGSEFSLLRYLMLNPGRLLSKYQIAEHLYSQDADRSANVIEVHISHIRDKLGRDTIITRRGQGYIFRGLQP